MPFIDPSRVLSESEDGRIFTLARELVYQSLNSGSTITIPAGFSTDGGSTPKLVWSLGYTPFGAEWRAYILHDYLYRNTFLPRDFCDDMLLEAMDSLGVSKERRVIIYNAVRAGGLIAFNNDRKQ